MVAPRMECRKGLCGVSVSYPWVRIPLSPPIILTITVSYQPAGAAKSHLLNNRNMRFANGMQTPLSGNVLSRDPAHRGDEDATLCEILIAKQFSRPCTHKSRLVNGGWTMSGCSPKRTFVSELGMSALCHKQTCRY